MSCGGARVSVIIPCYRQAHYLGEAIASARAQSHPAVEIVVVDDGSPDRTAEVAAGFPGIRYVRQENQGLSAARNTGIRASTGQYLVFLDADDRLVPDGLAAGVRCLAANPGCAFVSGHHRYIDGAGAVLREHPQQPIGDDPFRDLLEVNYISMCATVMYRREILDVVGNFSTALESCEDYDLYLRIARRFPIARHGAMVAEYRWHDDNMTHNAPRMLSSAVTALEAQWEHVRDRPDYVAAYRAGLRFWRNYFGGRVLAQLQDDLRRKRWAAARSSAKQLLRYAPLWVRVWLLGLVRRP